VPTKAVLENEITESKIGNASSAFSSFLKIPTAGYRHNKDGKFGGPSSSTLWSRSAAGSKSSALDFSRNGNEFRDKDRAFGFSVRCIMD
jgi:hypothetical protein